MKKGIRNKDKYKLLVSDISYSKLTESRHPSKAGTSKADPSKAGTSKAGTSKAGTSKADPSKAGPSTEQLHIKSLKMSVDKECYSCLCDVHEKSKYIICMCCKKILHEKCYDDWIKKTPKMKSTCSYCQQEGVLVKYTNPSKKTLKFKRCLGCTEFIQL
tara:strand:+ start:619 stop:1095 length:477 start_codon:yes stop_codon:yes gene_type:complete